MAVLDSLFVELGYKYDDKALKRFNAGAKATTRILKGAALGAIGVASSIAIMYSNIARSALEQKRFGNQVNLSRKEVEALKRTSEQLTGDKTAGRGLLENLFNIQVASKAGIKPNETFLRGLSAIGIGLSEFENIKSSDLIESFSESLQGLGKEAQDTAALLLGVTGNQKTFLTTLKKGQLKANEPSSINIAAIEKTDKLLRDMKNVFSDLITDFGNPLLEKFVPVLKAFSANLPEITSAVLTATSFIGDILEFVGVLIGEHIARVVLLIERFTPDFKKAVDKAPGFFSNLKNFVTGKAPSSTSSLANSSTETVNQEINISIISDNPIAVADKVEEVLNNGLKTSRENLSSSSKI